MWYKSTRNSALRLKASQVIAQGISEEGGLFVPEALPKIDSRLSQLSQLDYRGLAKELFSLFLTDFTPEEIDSCVEQAYAPEKFGGEPVRLTALGENTHLLELWHGPTCAFKDMALQILPHFLSVSLKKSAPGKEAVILVATSGDTGKAALDGFQDVPSTRIMVFYPVNGVSPMQKLQMVTQEGNNVYVCAIEGNFDDAQTAVKKIFTDAGVKEELRRENLLFSSANSINWGRLLPQIVYYFYAYFQLCNDTGKLEPGQKMNVVVPTGNFGNILAAYYAREMGLPIGKLICASNANCVLTDFIRTGIYDKRRTFFTTSSPSMDILVSSNLERLLYALAGESDAHLAQWMQELGECGVYQVGPAVLSKMQQVFYGGCCDDTTTYETVKSTFDRYHVLCDTHTAVGVQVCSQYQEETGDRNTPTVIASTASPYKFGSKVLGSLEPVDTEDEFEILARLEALTGTTAPAQLRSLREKSARFEGVCVDKSAVLSYVRDTLKESGR